ncbi:uncharacterized protein LOC117302516 isoform X1 [Asterias rubens]|uniref:uncharacterized protein LOC117302516 isoform X1 n=1 Tax=Asterias rubens TaxID=7604 RepID=UPI0014551750|nr:uncharacterized protein LOC117302516 isoform X1 [Asterias rubens]
MFGKKGAIDEMEAAKLASLKHYLSRELSTSIKKLQKDHISSDSAIRSGETANKICNLVEAVFLHDLKESYSSKTPWPFLVKFTHKDVVSQLKGLRLISTEIGYCRAWVRLALNDGLLDSYMDAILSDGRTIQSYYKRTSFLRDTEEPHIMKNYLQGLVNFTFQLSFNSSLLNVWGAAPLIIAGSWDEPRERNLSNPNASRKIVTGGPPLGINPADRTSQDLLSKSKDGQTTRGQRALSFEGSFHECEISSTLLRSPSEDGSTLMSMGEPIDVTYADRTIIENRENPPVRDFPGIVQDSYEDGIVIHLVSDSTLDNASGTVDDKVETVYQSISESKHFTEERTDMVEEDVRPEGSSNPFDLQETDKKGEEEDEDIFKTKDTSDEPHGTLRDNGETTTPEGVVEETKPTTTPEDDTKEEEYHRNHGNSLGAMSGWSSVFQNPVSPETPSRVDSRLEESVPHNAVSYNTILQQYTLQGPQPATFLQDPSSSSGDLPAKTEQPTIEGAQGSRISQSSDLDDIASDFEVIPLSTSPTSQYADARTQSLLAMVTEIGREKGLDRQNYQCKGCSRPVGIIYGKARVCNYDGCYYCYECHQDDEAIIPARILYNWDFRKHKVAVHTKSFLQQIEAMPLIDVNECNPSLYKASSELNNIMTVRSQLKYLKAYLFTCKKSVAEELRKKIWPREYMLDHVHLYTVQDFLQVQSGVLLHFLRKVIVFAAKHVQQCGLCSQKGFICLICESPKIIYPFDTDLTIRCETCKTVFHKACKVDTAPCPKCERRLLRRRQLESSPEDLDFASPFT